MPDEDSGAEGLGPVAILVILVLGACLSVLVWQSLRRHWEIEIERQTEWYASSLGDMLDAEFARLDGLLRRRAQIWVTPTFSERSRVVARQRRKSCSRRTRRSWPCCARTSARRSRALRTAEQILREVLPEARRQAADLDRDFIVGPLRATNGREVFGVQMRASSDGRNKCTVFALFDAQRVVKDMIDERAPGFARRRERGRPRDLPPRSAERSR